MKKHYICFFYSDFVSLCVCAHRAGSAKEVSPPDFALLDTPEIVRNIWDPWNDMLENIL